MLKGIDVNQRIEFVSKDDVSEPKTVFILRPFSGIEMVSMSQFFDSGKMALSGDGVVAFLEKAIVEIKNFKDGLSVKEAIQQLSGNVLGELVNEIASINNLTGQDQKN